MPAIKFLMTDSYSTFIEPLTTSLSCMEKSRFPDFDPHIDCGFRLGTLHEMAQNELQKRRYIQYLLSLRFIFILDIVFPVSNCLFLLSLIPK